MRPSHATPDWSAATLAVTLGRPHGAGQPVNPPLTLSSIFRAGEEPPAYAREHNPTWEPLEEAVGALEGGIARAFASGIAAAAAVIDLVGVGGVIVVPADAYTGVRRQLALLSERGRLSVRPVDIADTDATVAACDGADLLWAESPTNPMMAVADLAALAAGAHAAGALFAVDNTFATPLLQRPLEFGADLVVHSATKFLSGHSDVLSGVTVAATEHLDARLHERRTLFGAVPAALDAWLVLRGLRTLGVRLERAQATASELARRLVDHPAVARVRYPGLTHDPGHERAGKQMDGFGAMLSVELAGGAPAADALCTDVRLVTHATSLGGVETTLERRGRQPGEEAVPPGLVRISVGCEDLEDLWRDLLQALSDGQRP